MSVDIIILALIAIILLIKLFTLFGQDRRLDHFEHTSRMCASSVHKNKKPSLKDAEVNFAQIADPLTRIKKIDSSFKEASFVKIAKHCYKDIMDNYAKGDTHAFYKWVNIDVMQDLAREVADREEKGLKETIEIVKLDATITDILCDEHGKASISILFESEMINYLTDDAEKLLEGSKTKLKKKKQAFIFSKHLFYSQDTWKLIKIEDLK